MNALLGNETSWFTVAAVMACLCLGMFVWAEHRLEPALDEAFHEQRDDICGTYLKSDAERRVALAVERDASDKLRAAMRSGLRLARTGFAMILMFLVVGLVLRIRANRGPSGRS